MQNIFEIATPLGLSVSCTHEYWEYVTSVKHPVMKDKEDTVINIFRDPDEIRKSRIDPDVYLYYRKFDRLFCAVAKHEGTKGFLITAYPTDKVKEGEVIWTR